MRTQKTILNLVYALGSSLLLMLLGFATRRLLVFNFGNDITAASQVVDKLFNFFSIAEFGVGSVISYRLYEQIAAKDTEKISKYMSMYKWAYRAVGVVICVLAGIGALALPWIMPGVAQHPDGLYRLPAQHHLHAVGLFPCHPAADVHLHPAGVPVYPHRLLL